MIIEQPVRITHIRRVVSEYYNLTSEELCQDTRLREIARPRQVAMYLSRLLTDLSQTQVAMFFKRKDPSTVSHAVGCIEELILTDKSFAGAMEDLKELIIKSSFKSIKWSEAKEAYKRAEKQIGK